MGKLAMSKKKKESDRESENVGKEIVQERQYFLFVYLFTLRFGKSKTNEHNSIPFLYYMAHISEG